MVKHLRTALILAGLSTQAFADSITYTTIETDPRKYKPTVLSVDLVNCDLYHELSAGYGLKLETVILGRLMPYAGFKGSWYDGASHKVFDDYPEAPGGMSKQFNTDVGATLFLLNSVKERKVRVVLSSYGNSHYRITHFTWIPSQVKRMFGVEGGIFYNRKGIAIKGEGASFYNYKDKATGAEVAMPTSSGSGTGLPAGDATWAFPMTNTVSFYGGIRYRNIKNTVIRAEGYGKRSNANVVDFYADLMLAPVSTIGDVTDKSGKQWEMVQKSGAVNHMGYRVGFSSHCSRTFGFSYYMEFGKRPGPVLGDKFANQGGYLSLGVGFSIGSGLQLNIRKHDGDKSSKKAEKNAQNEDNKEKDDSSSKKD